MTVPSTEIADSKSNPYSAEDMLGPYQGPHSDFAVPEHEQAPYYYEGWAQSYRTTEMGIPEKEPIDTYPHPRNRGLNLLQRHTVENQDGDGWTIQKDGLNKRSAPDPRRNPPPESRLTQQMSPNTYSFVRPFDQVPARTFTGNHFSMADHRRDYEIGGMAPIHRARNTYRIEPPPWDTDIVDVPPNVTPEHMQPTIYAVDIPPSGNRSWRL